MLKVRQTRSFAKSLKKLKSNQRNDLEKAITNILKDPLIGDKKVGDLNGVYVYKFSMNNQLALLAYCFDENQENIILMAVGPHENFYRELKRI